MLILRMFDFSKICTPLEGQFMFIFFIIEASGVYKN